MDVPPGDAMGDVEDANVRCDAADDPVHDTDELVVVTEIAEEGDGNTHGRSGYP